MLPRDIDLTHNLDFNKKEVEPSSIKLSRTKKDTSYKRYNEYANQTTTSTLTTERINITIPRGTGSNTTASIDWPTLHWNTIKKEEKVCFRRLYKDPSIYAESRTLEEAEEHLKDLNFAMGGKWDRQKIHYEKLKMMEEFCAGYYCDCCGKKLNRSNCLTHNGGLCNHCNNLVYESVNSVRL